MITHILLPAVCGLATFGLGWWAHKKFGTKTGAVELAVKSAASSVEQAAKKL
jgi:hypothetical protein